MIDGTCGFYVEAVHLGISFEGFCERDHGLTM
jgi:hypothetical protein